VISGETTIVRSGPAFGPFVKRERTWGSIPSTATTPVSSGRKARTVTTDTRTLLLTQGYEPIDIISWQRAITLLTLDKVDVLEEYDAEIRAPRLVLRVPAVVRLRKLFRRTPQPVKFSRVNIYARDHYRCQYCGDACGIDALTYDHVLPRSKGGKTTWENIVSACYACNRRKANRTPAEAGMKLLSVPKRPTWMPAVQIRVSTKSVPDAWRDYVYWTGEIENEDGGAD